MTREQVFQRAQDEQSELINNARTRLRRLRQRLDDLENVIESTACDGSDLTVSDRVAEKALDLDDTLARLQQNTMVLRLLEVFR